MKQKVSDVLNIEAELQGMVMRKPDGSQEIVFKGLLTQPIPLKVKYHLNRFMKVVESEKETYRKSFNEIIDEVNPVNAETGVRPEATEDQKKTIDERHKELLNQEIDLNTETLKHISLNDFGMLSTEFNYPFMLNIIGI